MHVAILCEYGTINGGENSILAMAGHLPEIDFTFLAPAEGRLRERITEAGLRHVPLSLHDADNQRLPRDVVLALLKSAVDQLAPDLLHANSLSMGRLSGALADQLPIPVTAHLRDILRVSRATINDHNRNDRLIAVSAATRDFHIGQGLDAERTDVVYNGIDTGLFHPHPSKASLLAELNLPTSVRLVGTIGQIGLRKGLRVLIDAALATSDVLPDVHYLIIGERFSAKPESIAYEHDLHDSVAAAGLQERVHWLGYRDDVPQLLNAMDLLVHPALQEPLGRVLLEASACGLPIIATDVGGTAEILTDDVSGVLIPPDDPAALSTAMRNLFDDQQRRQRLGTAARQTAVTKFEISARANELAGRWVTACQKDQRRS